MLAACPARRLFALPVRGRIGSILKDRPGGVCVSIEDRVVAWLARQDVKAYLVGGCVRDRLLGRIVHDLDVAVSGDGLALARQLADWFDGDYHALDRQRGTGRAILRRGDGERLLVDIARFRGSDLAADLTGRDFTINALAIDVRAPAVVIDHHGGLADLAAGLIRAVSEDAVRDDPLRALRAVRQAAQLGFSLVPGTEALIQRSGAAVASVPAERICEELSKLLACDFSAPFLFELDRLGLLGAVLPELEPLRDLNQSSPHQYGVLKHSLEAVGALEALLCELGLTPVGSSTTGIQQIVGELELGSLPDHAAKIGEHLNAVVSDFRPRLVVLKMAALLHDVGKPDARSLDEQGGIRFLGHELAGGKIAGEALRRLRFSGSEASLAELVVRNHMRPLALSSQVLVSGRAVYRFFRDTGDAGVDVLLLSLADHLATYFPEIEERDWQHLVHLVTRMLSYYWDREAEPSKSPPLIDGRVLIDRFGLEPGPQIGKLLEAVREAQAVGEVSTRYEAIELVRDLIEG